MKQMITVQQLNKLTDEQKERLNEWWKPQAFDHYVNQNMEHFFVGYTVNDKFVTYGDDIPHGKEGMLPLLSIGQMIQLLREDFLNIIVGSEQGMSIVSHGPNSVNFKSDELCDALWEAIVQILKNTVQG